MVKEETMTDMFHIHLTSAYTYICFTLEMIIFHPTASSSIMEGGWSQPWVLFFWGQIVIIIELTSRIIIQALLFPDVNKKIYHFLQFKKNWSMNYLQMQEKYRIIIHAMITGNILSLYLVTQFFYYNEHTT